MRKNSTKLMAILSLTGVVFAVTAAISEGTPWFTETTASYTENAENRWHTELGTAKVEDDRIKLETVSLTDPITQGISYTPAATTTSDKLLISELDVSFTDVGYDALDAGDSFVGIQVLQNPAVEEKSGVFAVLEPTKGTAVWRKTTIPATFGQQYFLRIEVDATSPTEYARYFYRTSESASWSEIALVKLPSGSGQLNQALWSGEGSVAKIETATTTGGGATFARYLQWAYADAILTWQGGASSRVCREFVYANGSWSDGTTEYADDAAKAKLPTSTLRFAGSVTPAKMDLNSDSIAGIIVESEAMGYSIEQAKELKLGLENNQTATRFEFGEDFKLGNGYQVTLNGDAAFYVASGKTVDLSAASSVKLNSANSSHLRLEGAGAIKLPSSGLDVTGSTVVDLSGLKTSPASAILGKLRIDGSTAFVLPAGSQAGEAITLCRDAVEVVSGGTSGQRQITVDGVTYSAAVTISGNQLVYSRRSYQKWVDKPAVFTWAGKTSLATSGLYRLFSADVGTDTDTEYVADGRYRNVPGWGESPVPEFDWVFSTEAYDLTAMPFAQPEGYVVRFAGSQTPSTIDLAACRNRFGGLIVEAGTSQAGFAASGSGDVEIGNYSSTATNYVEVGADFAVDGNQLEILGRTEIDIATGVNLAIDGKNAVASAMPNPDVMPELRLSGDGVINCNELQLDGPATLDMSKLSLSRTDPYIHGDLLLGTLCRFVFPESLAASTPYPLCTGGLTAVDGTYAVALGDNEYTLAKVTFDSTAKTIQYSSAVFQECNVDGDCNWSNLSLTDGKSAKLVLSQDATVTIDGSYSTVPALLVSGGHKLRLLMRNTLNFGSVFMGRDSSCEVVYDSQCAKFGKELEIGAGLAYDTVIESSTSVIWSEPVTISGRLIVRGNVEFQDVGGAIGRGAVIEVAKGGSLKLNGEVCRAVGARFVVNGELILTGGGLSASGGTRFEFGNGGKISGAGGLSVDGPIAITVKSGAAATVSTELTCNSSIALTAESASSSIAFQSAYNAFGEGAAIHPYGEGTISIAKLSQLSFTGDTFVQGGITGGGTAVFTGDPADTGVEASLGSTANWSGACHFKGVIFDALNPANFGNDNSSLIFEGCSGVFDQDAEYDGPSIGLASVSEDYPVSLTIPDGYDGKTIVLNRLFGDGKLKVGSGDASRIFRVSIPDGGKYTGSLLIDGTVNHNAISLGVGTETVADGTISVLSGEANIGTGAEWVANSGIFVAAQGTVYNGGRIGSEVSGSGTVVYSGEVDGSEYPETAANFGNQTKWLGEVRFENANLIGIDPQVIGNANSRVAFRNSSGKIKAGTILGETEMQERGLRVTGAVSEDEVRFNSLVGDGDFSIDCAGAAYYRIPSVENFTGSIVFSNGVSTAAIVVIGEDAKLKDQQGILQISDGTVLDSDLDWSAPKVVFGDGKSAAVTVNGEEGDDLMSITGNDVDFAYVRVTLVGSVGRIYGLSYDGDRKRVYITARATPPSFDSEVSVVYGLDFTNAMVRLNVSNFNQGYQYGNARAEVFVYDAYGNICGYGSVVINGDGTFSVPDIDLPSGQGGDYRYDVVISAEADASGEAAQIDSASYFKPGVHLSGDWFHENATTFAATDPAQKTGDWYSPSEEPATVTNEIISIMTTGDPVRFVPYIEDSNDVVKVETRAAFHAACDLASFRTRTRDAGALTALSIVKVDVDTEDERLVFAVYSHAADDAVMVFGKQVPKLDTEYTVAQTINHRTGFVSYEINGESLTNENGVSSFAISAIETARQVKEVAFTGVGDVAELSGKQLNSRLAGVEINGATNEYYSVNEAVAAAVSNGVSDVNLLWDATWTPLTNDVGRTIAFTMNGHVLYIDPALTNSFVRQGYQVINNHDGSYTIGVIDYFLTFYPNGGTGSMAPQAYSVTNMVFNLATNEFVSASGFDFAMWNQLADGSGPTNWEDGAVIDMTEFGRTNMSMYAQWKIAVRYVTIESADEFVYVELVMTNNAVNRGVKYIRDEDDAKAMKGIGKAEIPIESGTKTLEVRFSTDIERVLSYVATNWTNFSAPFTVKHDYLPVIVEAIGSKEVVDLLHLWAAENGIPEQDLTSPYAKVSCALNLSHVINESSEVRISDFTTEADGCSFKVEIDDEQVTQLDKVLPMVRLSTDLSSADNWQTPVNGEISVDGDSGKVKVKSTNGAFIKLVVGE